MKLNNEIKEILDRMEELVKHKYDKEIHTYRLFDDVQDLLDYITNLEEENEMYAQLKDEYEDIINKAIEYIELIQARSRANTLNEGYINIDKLLNILQGEDNE